jgi:hypothetical protein
VSHTNQVESDYNLLKKTNAYSKLYIESLSTKIVGLVHKIEKLNKIAIKHEEKQELIEGSMNYANIG